MKFKKSFEELKKPIVLVHYLIGTIGILLVFVFLMNQGILTASSSNVKYGLIFYFVYAFIDRVSHALLELF
jgi:hypothetical protein